MTATTNPQILFWTFLLLLTGSISTISAQNNPLQANFKKGRFYSTEGYEIKFKSLKSDGDYYIYNSSKNDLARIKKEDILRIDVQNGSHALTWAGYSGIISLATAWLTLESTEKSLHSRKLPRNEKISLISILTGIGIATGALLGNAQKKYTRIYENDRLVKHPNSFKFNTTMINDKLAFGFSFSF